LHPINPELYDIEYKVGESKTQPTWQSYKFQALAESGCLDQEYYNEDTINSKFGEISDNPQIWTEEITDLLNNPTNWDIKNENIVCNCINDIVLDDADALKFYTTAENFKKKIKDTCYDDNKIPIFFVEAFENVGSEHVDRHFSRFMLGIVLLVSYSWSVSAKSWIDANLFEEKDIHLVIRGLGVLLIFVASPSTMFVSLVLLLGRCISDVAGGLHNSNAFDKLIMSLGIFGVAFLVLSWGGLAMVFYKTNPRIKQETEPKKSPTIGKEFRSFRSSAQLRTIMDYAFVSGGTIALVYASIMAGISSLASICTLFILAISIFYSIHVNFYIRNQLDLIMSNLHENIRGHVFNTGGKQLEMSNVKTIETGLRPFANSIVMTRLTYLMLTLTLLISIVFMARDTPVASESYILSYQVNWIVLVFLTLCTFSYDFFNEVQQKIIKYVDHDLIVYAVIFISFHVIYIIR
jgi:hypothetical protein